MDKVASCLSELPHLFKAFLEQNTALVTQITAKIAHLEHEADLTKNDIRNHLPNSIFLPLDRSALLDILSLQDSLADQSEAISRKAEMRSLKFPDDVQGAFALLCQRNMEVFWLTREVIRELEELLESSLAFDHRHPATAQHDAVLRDGHRLGGDLGAHRADRGAARAQDGRPVRARRDPDRRGDPRPRGGAAAREPRLQPRLGH